jgi:fatty-acyl-CoA synthase
VRKGDRVILLMQNMAQLVIGHFAIQRANAVVVPVNPMNLAEELKHYITDGGVKLAITTADLAPELAKASNALAAADRLSHMVVTQLNDYLPEGAACEPMPEAWEAWLNPRALPALDGGSVSSWKDAVATTARCRRWKWGRTT